MATDDSNTHDLWRQMKCLHVLATNCIEHAESFANKMVITKLCGLLKSKNSAIFLEASKILSMLFVYEKSPTIIDTAILEGVLPNLLQLMFSSIDQESMKLILFGLSNITGSTH